MVIFNPDLCLSIEQSPHDGLSFLEAQESSDQ